MAEEKKTEKLEKAWYVLRAISGKEAKVKEVLDGAIRNTPLGNYVFQVLIPTEKVVSVKNGKKVVKEKNLYGGYVFVECILTGEVLYELRNTTNVIDFLKGRGKDAKPEPLREVEIRRMLGAGDDPTDEAVADNDFMVGEQIKVTDGAQRLLRKCAGSEPRAKETHCDGHNLRAQDAARTGVFASRAHIIPDKCARTPLPIDARRTRRYAASGTRRLRRASGHHPDI